MTIAPKIHVKLLRAGATLPRPMSDGSAGADIAACLDDEIRLSPGSWAKVPTGIAIAVAEGFEGEVRPRSGLAAKFGVTLLNSPGTIDSDYRGEVCVILINHGKDTFTIRTGDRIAQLLIKSTAGAQFEIAEELPETDRSAGGFGSTGV